MWLLLQPGAVGMVPLKGGKHEVQRLNFATIFTTIFVGEI